MDKRLFLGGCLVPLLFGCANAPNLVVTGASRDTPYPNNPSKRQDVVMQAMAMLDRNYVYGGKKLHTGFDCSGLVSFVYKESAGIALRGSSAQMANITKPILPTEAHPADLVFFNTLNSPFSHVGIYIGSGKFIHAANEKTGVKVERLNHVYWAKRFEGYRTIFA